MESIHLGCVSQDSHPRKSFLRREGNLGSDHAVKFSKKHVPPYYNSGKKGSIARKFSKSVNLMSV